MIVKKHPLLAASLFALALAAGGADAASLQVQPNASAITLGDTLSVQFTIADLIDSAAPSLGSYDLNVDFDASVLSYSGFTWGNQLDLFGLGDIRALDTSAAASGHLNAFEVSLDDSADLDGLQAGNFTLFSVSFTAVGTGSSFLTLGINDLGNSVGESFAPGSDIANSSVAVNAVPVPATLPLFASALLALTHKRIRRRA